MEKAAQIWRQVWLWPQLAFDDADPERVRTQPQTHLPMSASCVNSWLVFRPLDKLRECVLLLTDHLLTAHQFIEPGLIRLRHNGPYQARLLSVGIRAGHVNEHRLAPCGVNLRDQLVNVRLGQRT